MSAIPQQIADRQKDALETLLAVQNSVFAGFEKLVDLNLKATRAALDDAAAKSKKLAAVKDPQEVSAVTASLVQASPEQALAYGKQVYDIISGVQGELTKLVEARIADNQKLVADAIDQISKNAPAGSESAVALIKSSLATANNAYDSLTKAAKQAAEVTESNLNAAASATARAAAEATEAAVNAAKSTARSAAAARK
ncbi:MAG: TIGR01841 family phasin [Corticimicrobacter sp.]|uniref:phasin family protein n=1 Tax=Corticimicrobacter sp. TaxID=2678536 RepID=UPI00118106C1|nr:phasin family protein [Alcaligenaceae bacterium SJ-26]